MKYTFLLYSILWMVISCSDTGGSNTIPTNEIEPFFPPQYDVTDYLIYFPLRETTLALFQDTFESGPISTNWTVTGKSDAAVVTDNTMYYIGGSHSLKLTSSVMAQEEFSGVSYTTGTISENHAVSFYYKTDLLTENGYTLQFLVNGDLISEWEGSTDLWQVYSHTLTGGTSYTLEWQVKNSQSSYGENIANTAWIDFISIVPDRSNSITFIPNGPQKAVVGETEIPYTARALRLDGSVKEGVTFTYSIHTGAAYGELDNYQTFRGISAGKSTIQATGDNVSGISEEITVVPKDHLSHPFEYNKTLYYGKTTEGSGSPLINSDPNLLITQPATSFFECDGFFALQGENSHAGRAMYTLIRVKKGTEQYDSFLNGAFCKRIWLPFGAGDYTIQLIYCEVTAATIDTLYDGDISAFGIPIDENGTPVVTYQFTASNTRDEDGRWIYPSLYIQSDDIGLYNTAMREGHFINNSKQALIVRLHDYVVAQLYYDRYSLDTTRRKKQDAVSVLENGTAVCEGYAGLYSALLRLYGFRAKAVAGYAATSDGPVLHAWTNVMLDSAYYFIDATWNDPVPNDVIPSRVSYEYLLLDELTGINGDHDIQDERPERNIKLPDRKGLTYTQITRKNW